MPRVTYFILVALIFAAADAVPFTPGNFIITYVNESFMDLSSTDIYPTFIEELTPDGTSVQTIEISSSCSSNSNIYQGAPRLSTDGQHITFTCYIPNGLTTDINQLTSAVGVMNQNGELDISTQFIMPSGRYTYRATKDGDDIYIAGDNTISYIPFGGTQDQRIELSSNVQKVQDVIIYEGNLLATNYFANGFGLARVGSGLPVKTTDQILTNIWTGEITWYPDGLTFFEQNGEKYAYLSQEDPVTLYKLKFVNGSWTKLYNIAENTNQDIIVGQIFYDNGDNTKTVLFTDLFKNIYKTIDDGSKFSAITPLTTRPDFVIKGIEKVPVTITVPQMTPVNEPIATPIDVPVTQPMTDLGPISEPISMPVSEPVTDVVPVGSVPINSEVPVAANEPITSTVPVKSTPSARITVNCTTSIDISINNIIALVCIVSAFIC